MKTVDYTKEDSIMDKDKFVNENNFKRFIFAVLRQKLSLQNKRFYTNDELIQNDSIRQEIERSFKKIDYRDIKFDAYAPDGIGDDERPLFIEIKYNLRDNYVIPSYLSTRHYLLITNAVRSDYKCCVNKLSQNTSILIWDKPCIDELIKQYSIDYYANISEEYLELDELKFDYKNQNNITMLIHDIKMGKISLALGAGVSLEYGSKSWEDLVNDLYDELVKSGVISNVKDIKKKIGGTSIINGQFAEDNLKDFIQSLENELYAGYSRNISDTAYADTTLTHLIKLINKLKDNRRFNVISYNYDFYLEELMKYNHIKYNLIYHDNNIVNNDLSVYHPHGYLPITRYKVEREEYRKHIVFGESEYHKLYNNPYSWQIIIQEYLFRESKYLFVGCSLTDPNLRRILENVQMSNRYHYALMLEDGCSIKDKFIIHKHFAKLGVECIWYDNANTLKLGIDYIVRSI